MYTTCGMHLLQASSNQYCNLFMCDVLCQQASISVCVQELKLGSLSLVLGEHA